MKRLLMVVFLLVVSDTASADLGTAIAGGIFGSTFEKNTNRENASVQVKAEADAARLLDPELFDHFFSVTSEGWKLHQKP